MSNLWWLLGGGLLMSGIAMAGSLALMLPPQWLDRLLLPLVAVAAGTLLGGALFHMLPHGIAQVGPTAGGFWMAAGCAAAAHEVPQELGDFGVLVHGGWPPRSALMWNFISALTFPAGALLAYAASQRIDIGGLALFGAGNFLSIAAPDLIPEIKAPTDPQAAVLHFALFVAGVGLVAAAAATSF